MAVADTQEAVSATLRVVQTEGKGRGLVAAIPLKAGQIVLRDSPILLFSASPLKHQEDREAGSSYSGYCAHCFKCLVAREGPGARATFTCPLCSHPDDGVFCSTKCQSLALQSTHTPWACQALSYLRNCSLLLDYQPEERQLQARFLVVAYNLAMVSPSVFETLLSFHGDAERFLDSAMFLHSIFSLLPSPKGFPAFSVEMIASLLAKESCNSFSLMEPLTENGGSSARAYGFYPNATIINHDCIPNVCRFDNLDSAADGNTDIIFRMIHDVPQGQEVCASYFSVSLSYAERNKRLQDYFGFDCVCSRCNIESKWLEEDNNNDVNTRLVDIGNTFLKSNGEGNRVENSTHGCFIERFVCVKDNCGGSLAPLPPSGGTPTRVLECNFCGSLKKDEL